MFCECLGIFLFAHVQERYTTFSGSLHTQDKGVSVKKKGIQLDDRIWVVFISQCTWLIQFS